MMFYNEIKRVEIEGLHIPWELVEYFYHQLTLKIRIK
jgi:hypothetical protein